MISGSVCSQTASRARFALFPAPNPSKMMSGGHCSLNQGARAAQPEWELRGVSLLRAPRKGTVELWGRRSCGCFPYTPLNLHRWILHSYMAIPGIWFILSHPWPLLLCVDPLWKLEIYAHSRIMVVLVTRFPFPDPQPFGLMLMSLSEGRRRNVALGRWGKIFKPFKLRHPLCAPLVGAIKEMKGGVGEPTAQGVLRAHFNWNKIFVNAALRLPTCGFVL